MMDSTMAASADISYEATLTDWADAWNNQYKEYSKKVIISMHPQVYSFFDLLPMLPHSIHESRIRVRFRIKVKRKPIWPFFAIR